MPVGYLDVQAEKQKAAAIKAAQEKAAQDYEREVQQLNAMKLQNEARINEKVKKAKQKARKKEEAVHTDEVCSPYHSGLHHHPSSSGLRPHTNSFTSCL